MIRLYFPLDALPVSDYISPSSGATFISCTSHLVYVGTIRVAVVWLSLLLYDLKPFGCMAVLVQHVKFSDVQTKRIYPALV